MRAFITGGAGFIGQHIIDKLLERGYEVRALVRSPESAQRLSALGVQVIRGDITDMDSMRQAMQGSDVVFHLAGYADIGAPDSELMEMVNVGGTRKVLRLAQELHIPRIVFTSSVGVFGDTKGQLVDETHEVSGPFVTEHARTKWLAHYKVAQPLIEKGAPIIVVMPGAVYGPGGRGLVTDMMRIFYRGYPLVAGAETVLTFAHVEDIAEGHVLAAEKGRVGETYILSGPAVSLADMLDFWTYLTGVKAPQIRLPANFVRAFPPLMTLLGSMTGLKAVFSREAAQVAGKTFIARSDKARSELGWETRPLQGGMLKTLNWIAETEAGRHRQVRKREQQFGGLVLLAAGLLAVGWLLSRRRQ